MGVNSLPKTVTRQRPGCDLNLLRLSPTRYVCVAAMLHFAKLLWTLVETDSGD